MMQVGFNLLVHAFWLSIGLGVVCHTDILLYTGSLANCFGEMTCEPRISIWYDPLWYSKPGEKMLKVELRYAFAIYGLIAG